MKTYIVRKSFIDESTELARCSDVDLAISICKPGYSVFDEDGVPLYSSHSINRFNHGNEWIELKNKIESELIRIDSRRRLFITRKEAVSILTMLFDVLKLMNKVEVEDDKNTYDMKGKVIGKESDKDYTFILNKDNKLTEIKENKNGKIN